MRVLLITKAQLVDEQGMPLETILDEQGVITASEKELPEKGIDAIILVDAVERLPYLAALASAEQKPILCLLFKIDRKHVQFKENDLVTVSEYDPESLRSTLSQFLETLGTFNHVEKPQIKFTLRITPSMDRYLRWKSKQTGMTKADFLRKVIQEQLIDSDEDFKNS